MSRPPSQGWTRLLLGCGEVAGPLFTAVYLWQGALREGYRPRRHPVSSLALGERGAVQRASFAVAGSLFLAFAVGVRRSLPKGARARMLPSLLAGTGAGLLGAGTFATDPISGYPLGTPALPDSPSLGAGSTTCAGCRSSWGCRLPAWPPRWAQPEEQPKAGGSIPRPAG
ncbi:MAG: DUF998 domain-containing protein [Candidatus Dormibacteria bacterium]